MSDLCVDTVCGQAQCVCEDNRRRRRRRAGVSSSEVKHQQTALPFDTGL